MAEASKDISKIKTLEDFKRLCSSMGSMKIDLSSLGWDYDDRSKDWDDKYLDEISVYSWKTAPDDSFKLVCRRWMKVLKSGTNEHEFPAMTAWLVLNMRSPENVGEFLFKDGGKIEQRSIFEKFEDSTKHEATSDYFDASLDRLGSDIMYLAPFLAMLTMRACIRNANAVADVISKKGVSMYNQYYSANRVSFQLGAISFVNCGTPLRNAILEFKTVLIAALKPRYESDRASPIVRSMLDQCFLSHASYIGLGLIKMTLDATDKFSISPQQILDEMTTTRLTEESITRVLAFLAKYTSNGGASPSSVYYPWARNFESTYFLNLQPKANAHLFIILAHLVSEIDGDRNSNPTNSMAYKAAVSKVFSGAEQRHAQFAKNLVAKLRQSKAALEEWRSYGCGAQIVR